MGDIDADVILPWCKPVNSCLMWSASLQGMTGAISKCQQLVDSTPNAFCLQQFENPANPEVHYKTTGPEIWRDTAGTVDFLVAGKLLFLGLDTTLV